MNTGVIARSEAPKQSPEVATSLAVILATAIALLAMTAIGCSKAPEATAQNAGPDNAATRYAENLAQSEKRAQDAADKANAVIAGQQKQMDQTVESSQ